MNTAAVVIASDIESSAEYQALLVAAAGKPERSMGKSVIPAEPPAWTEVSKLAKQLVSEPPHVSVLVLLAKANANIDGFKGFYLAMKALNESMVEFWDTCIPKADPEDDTDPYYERVNYLRELTEDKSFINTIKAIPLVDVRGIGTFTAHDIDICSGKVSASEDDQARCQSGLVAGAFEQADAEDLKSVGESLSNVLEILSSIQQLFDERAGSEHGLNVEPLNKQLEYCKANFDDYAQAHLNREEDGAISGDHDLQNQPIPIPSDEAVVGDTSNSVSALPNIGSRQEVCRAFDQIISYYQINEPSHPVPILAQRARDMASKSFFDVLEDLAPTEKGNLPALLGVLSSNPLGSLLSDSYQRHLGGELVAPLESVSGNTCEVVLTSSAGASRAGNIGADCEDSTRPQEENDEQQSENVLSVDSSDAIAQQTVSGPPPVEVVCASQLSSRKNVSSLLDSIEIYFNRFEPSSPIPLILTQIRSLIPKRFSELVDEFNRVLDTQSESIKE